QEGSMRYVARRTAKGGFGPLLYALAEATGLSRAQQVVVLGDGAVWIWKLVAEHFPDAVQIVDLYHAEEHVWEVAHAVYGSQSQHAPASGPNRLVRYSLMARLRNWWRLSASSPRFCQPKGRAAVCLKKRAITLP